MDERSEPLLLDLEREGETVRIRLSDGRDLELAAGSLPPALPAQGEVVPPELLESLVDAAERKQVAREVFRLLDRRLRTRRDLERKLVDRGFRREIASVVLDRFVEQGVHSDRRYAEAWCRDTLRAKAVGRRYLVGKLAERGVARGIAEEVVGAELDDELERELAERAAGTWCRRHPGGDDMKRRARAQRFLGGRGFGPGLARAAVDAALKEEQA